jgi:hypothetical protein
MAGRASVELKGSELGLDLAGHPDAVSAVARTVKEREAAGWSFEAADASLELLMRSAIGEAAPAPFTLESYRVIIEHGADGAVVAEATVRVLVDGERMIATQEGNGPVNALDAALRAALSPRCPWLARVELSDYKGAHPQPRHRRRDARAGRVDGPLRVVDDRRRARQRRRGVLAGARGRPRLRGAARAGRGQPLSSSSSSALSGSACVTNSPCPAVGYST